MVTVMIPTYNQEEYIARAIESALAQTYPDLEIVISDDASTDGTEYIVRKYLSHPNIKYFRQETNIGRVNNYHKILYEYATGDWVLNLDGDDYLLRQDFIAEAIKAFENNPFPNVVLLCSDRYESDELENNPVLTCDYFWEKYDGTSVLLDYFGKERIFRIWHLTSIYKRDIAVKIGFYQHEITSSDQESLFRLILHGDILYTNVKTAVWQAHAKNVSKELNKEKTISNLFEYVYVKNYAIANNLVAVKKIEKWCKESIKNTVKKYIYVYAKSGGVCGGIDFYCKVIKVFKEAVLAIFDIKVLGKMALSVLSSKERK